MEGVLVALKRQLIERCAGPGIGIERLVGGRVVCGVAGCRFGSIERH